LIAVGDIHSGLAHVENRESHLGPLRFARAPDALGQKLVYYGRNGLAAIGGNPLEFSQPPLVQD
jgi:hypothetical protein